MGQKVHPIGIRLGVVKDWTSNWYAGSDNYADYLNLDLQVRDFIKDKLKHASVSRIQIERPANNAAITVHTARPGIVIGKKGGHHSVESKRPTTGSTDSMSPSETAQAILRKNSTV